MQIPGKRIEPTPIARLSSYFHNHAAVPVRGEELIEREYNQCKYAPEVFVGKTPDEVYYDQCAKGRNVNEWLFSENNSVYCASLRDVIARLVWKTQQVVKEFASDIVVELGCGYGFWADKFAGRTYLGGEYTENGVRAANSYGYCVWQHNHNIPADFLVIPHGSTVLTIATIEQLASSATFLDSLQNVRDKVARVIQLEPSVIPEQQSELGQLRHRYIAHNKYCSDLHVNLHNRSDIRILKEEHDFFGIVPLNPINLYVWEFTNV